MECKCDMRGMLSFQILWMVSKNKMCGEDIAKELGKKRGEKPKAGTIYPALKELRNKKLIKGEKSGKNVFYSITPEGEKTVNYAVEYFYRAFGDILKERRNL